MEMNFSPHILELFESFVSPLLHTKAICMLVPLPSSVVSCLEKHVVDSLWIYTASGLWFLLKLAIV